MAQKFQVLWAESAFADLEEIIDYITQDSPLTARKNFNYFKKKIADLRYSPQRGRYIPELQEQGILIYREIIISRWRVMYRVYEDKVYILAVIDARRNVEDILLEKLLKIKS